MKLKGIIDFIKISLEDKYKKEFYYQITFTNLQRGRVISFVVFIVEIIVLTISLIIRKEDMFSTSYIYYFIMYILFIVTMIIYMLLLRGTINKKQTTGMKPKIIIYSFMIFLLGWNMIITLLDGNVISYYIAIIAVGVIPICKPKVLFRIYLFVHIIFMALAVFVTSPDFVLFDVYINTTIALVISWFISFTIYKNKVTAFINQKKIEEQNEELSILNRKLIIANKKLDYLAKTDGLTGIYNRRMFDDVSITYWNECIKESRTLTIIMMDIDHFKPYNDNYGHQAGDKALKAIVLSLKKSIDIKEDIIARYGGEEFVAMIKNIQADKAYEMAEEIRLNIEKLNIEHHFSDVAEHITLSLGVYTEIPSKESTVEKFIKKADDALYKAKNGNRNKTIVA